MLFMLYIYIYNMFVEPHVHVEYSRHIKVKQAKLSLTIAHDQKAKI